MRRALQFSGILARIALTATLLYAALLLRSAKRFMDGMPEFTERQATEYRTTASLQADAFREELLEKIDKLGNRGISEVSAGRRDVSRKTDVLALNVDERTKQGIDVMQRLIVANGFTAMDEYKRTNEALRTTLNTAERQLSMLDNFKPYMECKGNGACLPAQTAATLGSMRFTLGAVAKHTPEIADSVEKAADSVERLMVTNERIATNIEAKSKRRFWGLFWREKK